MPIHKRRRIATSLKRNQKRTFTGLQSRDPLRILTLHPKIPREDHRRQVRRRGHDVSGAQSLRRQRPRPPRVRRSPSHPRPRRRSRHQPLPETTQHPS